MSAVTLNLPVDAESVADALDRHVDFRVQRRMRPMRRRETGVLRTGTLAGVVVDVETTGLDHRVDRVIELAVQSFMADEEGRIVETGEALGWLEDPRIPLGPEITRVTGLRPEDLKGRSIGDGEAFAALHQADVIIAHNSRFDRPFVEKRLPGLEDKAWACSLADVDWRGRGFEGRSLGQLLGQAGWFYQAHRATVDCCALLHLLDHGLACGGTVLKRMLETARRTTWRLEALDARRDASAALRDRGWRWDAVRKAWWVDVDDGHRETETEWAVVHAYACLGTPSCTRIDWTRRYAAF